MKKKKRNAQQRKRRQAADPERKAELKKKTREYVEKCRAQQDYNKKAEIKKQDRERRRLSRLCKKIGQSNRSSENGIDIHQSNFDCFMSSLQRKTCPKCKKKVIKSCYDKDKCKDCHLFRKENNMDPGELPDELKDLSFVEQQLIAKVHPVVSVYKIKRGEQFKYSGQVINFPQNIQEVCNVLPPTVNNLTNVLTVRVTKCEGYKDFHVRKDKVRNALLWLKKNNPLYEDVVISEENLDLLPNDGDVYEQTNGYEAEQSENVADDIEGVHYISYSELTEEEIDGIDLKDVPNLSGISEKDKVGHSFDNNVLLWPSIGVTPINEFGSPGYISMAFPHLFPYATADYSDRENRDISLSKYIQHLMLYYDERFAKDPRFRFFMMNSQMRWQSLNVGNVFVKKNNFFSEFTVLQLKEYLKTHPETISHIMFYSSRLRSTKSYWKSRCGELLDMVHELGSPTIFFTLSSADYHWKDLYRLLGVKDLSNISIAEKTKLISENPLIVSSFFKLRCEHFLHKCFFNKFKVIDYWYRVEFQHRGSSHVHGVIWIDGSPDIKNIKTEADKQNVIDYFDKLVSCQNPDITFTPNLQHPCEKSVSDCDNLDEDLAELVNRVQRHTKCSAAYCLRKSKDSSELVCRFGFPKTLTDKTELIDKPAGLEISFACNDRLLNKYNEWVLQTWRSNIDFTAIVCEDILYRYIAKYASKCEVKSNAYDELLKNILDSNQAEDQNCKKIIRRLLISTCAERDYCAQEVMFILMGFPLFRSSRQFVILNFKESVWESISTADRNEHKKTFVEHYITRPQYLDSLSLLNCAKDYYVKKDRWVKRRKGAVVRLFPRNLFSQDSEYENLKNLCILHYPWRNVNDFDVPDSRLSEMLTLVNHEWNENDELDIQLEWSDSECDDHSDEDEHDDKDDDWKLISKINAKRLNNKMKSVTSSSFKWDYGLDKYNLDVIHSICESLKTDKKATEVEIIDYNLLSVDQNKAFQHFCYLIDNYSDDSGWISDRLIIIQGGAGCGKTFLLKAMKSYCFQRLGAGSFAITASTGVSAKNVNGVTIHSFLHIWGKTQFFKDLTGEPLYLFQQKNKDLKVIFLDEYSMVGLRLLGMIDKRCREAKDNDNILGNLCVVMFGDINQLSSIFDEPLYTDEIDIGSNPYCQRGKLVLMSFERCFFLKTAMRFDNIDYIEFLDRLAVGRCTKRDVKMLRDRSILHIKDIERVKFKNALRICSTKDAAKKFNILQLENLNVPIARIAAENNCKKAFKCNDDKANGLTNILYLSVGARVMLRQNLNVSLGLVNGSLGTVVDIIYARNCGPPQLPLFVIVNFDGHIGFESLSGNVPVSVSQSSWYVSATRCTRAQLPLCLSWACTIHKSQSLTLQRSEVDIGTKEFQIGLTYVALSRVINAQRLIMITLVTLSRLNAIGVARIHPSAPRGRAAN